MPATTVNYYYILERTKKQ